ncbi:MAG: DUF1552 domain-containing protein [Acidobacteria bacterium]|nr:DUF1552 domain-containing protein [Acidobacteriota bacterium]
MMNFKKAIPRRVFLKGMGATVALPLLDSMIPAFAAKTDTAAHVTRVSFIYVPNGILMEQWTPATKGTNFELTPILKPLGAFQDNLLVLSGLAHNSGRALEGEGAGDHARASAVFLTGVHPKQTEGADLRAGISVDQIIAKEFGKQTQLASLEVALDSTDVVGQCDTGYSCAYTNTVSWRSETSPMPMENHPRALFERLFGDSTTTDPAERRARMQQNRSILDWLTQDVARLLRGLGPSDRTKLNEYLESLRDVERRIQKAEEQSAQELPTLERPLGIPGTFTEHAKLMFDLQLLAFQSDLTRVCTFMTGREQSNHIYRELGISDAYHGLTHHQHDPAKIAKVIQIDTLHTEVLAYFLEKMRSTTDGAGSLLDHSMVIYGSGLGDGNMHVHNDTPTLVVGGSTYFKGGRHLAYPQNTPTTNLYLTLLDKLGMAVERFGDSTGKLELLSVA